MTTDAPTPAPSAGPRRAGFRLFRRGLLVLLALMLGLAGFGAWLLQRPAGGAWLLAHLPGVEVEAPEGSLLGEFSARRLRLHWDGGEAELRDLRWSGLGASARSGVLRAREVVVQELHIRTRPSASPTAVPTDLSLPLGVQIGRIVIGRLSWDEGTPPLQQLVAEVELPRRGTHRVKLIGGRWQQLLVSGEAQVDSAAPLQTEARLTVQPVDGSAPLPWLAVAAARGPLAQLQAKAEVEAAHQTLKAQARVQPFAAWPVQHLAVQAEQFDLAALQALAPGLPRTALTGNAQLDLPARQAEGRLQVELHNARPGRWDDGALPVQRLVLAASARPDQLTSLKLTALDATLPGGGRVQGQGRHEADGRWQLDARVQGLRPEALDARAAPGRLDGPVRLSGGGPGPALAAELDVAGRLQDRPLRLEARVQGGLLAGGSRWQIDTARLSSGEAVLQARGSVALEDRPSGPRLSTELNVQLRQFDPHLLWQGAPGSAWSRLPGGTRLNAEAQLTAAGTGVQDATGQLDATVLPGQFAGLPVQGHLTVERARPADAARFDTKLRLGSSQLSARGSSALQTGGSGAAQWALQARKLAELNPLLALLAQGPVSGQADGEGDLQWQRPVSNPAKAARPAPATASAAWQWGGQGELTLTGAAAAGVRLTLLRSRWALPLPGADGDSPLSLELEALSAQHPRAELQRLRVQAQGRRSAHRIDVQLAGRTRTSAQGAMDVQLTTDLQARGGWAGDRWTGQVLRLDVGPLRPNTPALLAASQVGLTVGPGLQVVADPGRAEVGGAFVRWQTLSWRGGATPDLQAELTLEDLAAAPLLARWQPDFGWSGDLRVSGHASLRLTDRLTADMLLERQGGDLRVTDEFGPRALGLTDLRLAVQVRDGVWQVAQGLAGRDLGSLGGAITLRPIGLWPDARTPVEGVLQAQVADLGSWGSWVPAGWRVAGRAAATVQLGGRLGAPDLTGQASGDGLALRQLLYGVDFSDGRFQLDLKGQHAELTQLEVRGGNGWLRATGRAELGSTPQAHLDFKAEQLRLLSRVDRRVVASGQAALDLDAQGLRLTGQLKADEGLFDFSRADAPTLAEDVTVVRGPQAPGPTATTAPTPRRTAIDLALDFGRDFKVRGRGLATTLRGQLQLTQKDGNPLRVTGRLDARGGQYAAYGQKLEIERGDIRFTGALDNPALDMLAVRPNLDVRVGVQVGGNAQSPRISLFSEPDMTDTDKLSWLLLGRGPEGLGRTDTALLQRAALALLSGEGEGITGRALRQLGLDELSLSQSDDDTRATIVRLGKQISRRWYVGYERSLNATTGSWQLIYRIAQRFTLRAQSGDDNALDLIWQWRWN